MLRFGQAAAFLILFTLPATAQTFVFGLRGSQEVPPVATTSSGGCYGELDQAAATFSITCVHDVVGASSIHIHRGAAGTNGPVVFDMGDPSTSPVTATWTSMTPADIADLLAGDLYVNIHTAGRPAGEIRGQILPRTVDFVSFTADGSQVVPPNSSEAIASCTADLNDAATSLAIQCTHDLAGANAAHVHEAPAGSNGPIVFTFPSAASPLSANVPMTPVLVADFAATFLYLDIHTPGGTEEAPSPEIRGQIGTPPAASATGTIRIRKRTSPAGGTGFPFTETITSGNFTLDDGGEQVFANVPAGTYTVTEGFVEGWSLTDVSCSDADSSGNPFDRNATVRLQASETVTCTFTNLESVASPTHFVFHLSPDQEVPPVSSSARGGCYGQFDSSASRLSLVCTHDVDSAVLAHIHRAPAGANGPVVFDLGDPLSPTEATWDMTPADVADLLAGNLYVNIHTAGRPAGEIRGQIVPRTVDTVAFTADGSQVVPPNESDATADCTADLDEGATSLAIQCTHSLAGATAAHVHDAPAGSNGPIVFTFPSAASPLSGEMQLTPRLVADFAATFLYLDIHTPDEVEGAASDEIRGQIGMPAAEPTTGTIRIRKRTSPGGGSGFPFTETITNGGFTLDDGGEQVFTNVPAGTYTVTEGAVGGWSVTDVSCGDDDSTGNPFARNATVQLQAGETVVCTFANLQSVASPSHFVFHLSPDQEVPPVSSTARGGCYGQLDSAARRLSLVCTHNVHSPVLAHIHRAPAGANGPVAFDLGSPLSPIEATWNMTAAELADLQAGNFYVNIHASGRPEGEIRGQILPRTVDRFTFGASGAQEVPPTDSTATGNCLADLADNAPSVFVQCTHNVGDATAIHLHAAPPGVDGPVVFDFPNSSPFSGDAPLTPRLVSDFAAGFLYVNIHSPDYETGEIRGQLIGPAAAPPPPAAAAAADIPTLGEWAALLMMLGLMVFAWRRLA